jgi:hypothetical protein
MNPRAVRQADEIFHRRHPELGGRQLTMARGDRALRREWMQIYRACEAAHHAGFEPCDVSGAVAPCPPPPEPPASPAAPVPAPPPVPPPPPPSCTVEVRASELSPLGYYHLFIVFTDAGGTQHYLRGGPSAGGGGSSESSGELSGGSSRGSSRGSSGSGSNTAESSDSSRDTGGGPFGNIVTEYGEYTPDTIDWDPAARAITVSSGPETCALYAQLQAQVDAIESSNTRYNPLGPNSNSTVFTALRNVGITPQAPEGVWAPGADDVIDTD